MVALALAALLDLICLIGIYKEKVRMVMVIAIIEIISAVYCILALLMNTSGFILDTELTVAAAILSLLYWKDLKTMATGVKN